MSPPRGNIRGLGFKLVDFLFKNSDVCHTEIKMISSENIFFYLSYKLLSIALLIIVSTQQLIKHNDLPSPGARHGNFDVKTTSNFNKCQQ